MFPMLHKYFCAIGRNTASAGAFDLVFKLVAGMFNRNSEDRFMMTRSFPTQAAIRYGYGLSPIVHPPQSVEEMLNSLKGLDKIAQDLPIVSFSIRAEEEAEMGRLRRAKRKNEDGATELVRAAHRMALIQKQHEMRVSLLRAAVAILRVLRKPNLMA
jgi:hypothetical protein